MTTEPNEHVDEKLREAFAVDDVAATRMASRALAGPSRRWARRWARLRIPDLRLWTRPLCASLALATLALCAGLAAWLSRPTIVQPSATPQAGAVIQLSGSVVDGVLILPIPDDGIVIATSERRDRPRDGSGIVVVEGDVR
jgi:hypothetical protein